VNWEAIREAVSGRRVVFSVDVAKEDVMAVLMKADRTAVATVRWKHPWQTRELIAQVLGSVDASCLDVVMEPSGTYGDALGALWREAGVALYWVSPKRVHDAAELYDGVPSLHDAKAAYVIGRLHLEGVSQCCKAPSAIRRRLKAHLGVVEMYQERFQTGLNRLEALLSRHWPEVTGLLELGSVTLLTVIARIGVGPEVARDEEHARGLMIQTGRSGLKPEKVEQILASAKQTAGMACVAAEHRALQVLAQDLLATRAALRVEARALIQEVESEVVWQRLAPVVGDTTAAVLLCSLGMPEAYADTGSYLKGFGLNLKERSSGKHKGQLKLTKRGSSVARRYLYFAALRWIREDAVVRAWYQHKVDRDGGRRGRAITAVMRKLAKALWHVAQGEIFDPGKLFHVETLPRVA
jgi:transposase